MCRVAQVTRSGYYAWRKRKLSRRAEKELSLAVRIREIYGEHRGRYGAPRVHAQLLREGHQTSRKRVARIMRLRGLRGKRPRRYKATTRSDHDHPVAENLLARRFDAERPDDAWVGDITYLPSTEGWLYLAVLIDVYSRAVVGWATSPSLETSLCVHALTNALQRRRPKRSLLHHSDRGVQYASKAYRAVLLKHGITPSMSRAGNCWDNAVAESFFATLKLELGNELKNRDRDELRRALFAFIEGYYNTRRLHSTLGYRTPREVQRRADGDAMDVGMSTRAS